MKTNFIKTSHSATAEILKNLGFQLVNKSNGIFTFLNSDKISFSNDVDKTKIQYSNILTF